MKTPKQRINNVIGQLTAINRMIQQDEDCHQVIIQIKAVRSALGKIMEQYIHARIDRCTQRFVTKTQHKEIESLIAELLK